MQAITRSTSLITARLFSPRQGGMILAALAGWTNWHRDIICSRSMLDDFEQEKSGTEMWFLADARCPAGYQCRCPTLCRKPDSGLPHHPEGR
jgi:hypothetical protein